MIKKKEKIFLFLLLLIVFLSFGNVNANENDVNGTMYSEYNFNDNISINSNSKDINIINDSLPDSFNHHNSKMHYYNENTSFEKNNKNDLISSGESKDTTPPTITYITPSTIFSDSVLVEILCDDDTASIYYTIDGSDPAKSNTRIMYTEPFNITDSVTIHYTAVDGAGNYAKSSYNWLYPSLVDMLINSQIKYYDSAVTYLKVSDLNSDVIWSRYQDNNGVSNYSGSLNNITKWSNLEISSSGSVVIDKKGHIYVAGEDGYLYCLNNQGLVIWRYGTASKIISTPTIGPDENIYFSNWMNSSLYCISPDGDLLWKYVLGDYNAGSSPVFGRDGTLYVVSVNNKNSFLFAFKDKNLSWTCKLPLTSGSTPAVSDESTIYLVSTDHDLVAVNWDGTLKYTFSLINTVYPIDKDLKESQVSVTVDSDGTFYVINQPHYHSKDSRQIPISYISIRAYYADGSIKWYNTQLNYKLLSGAPTLYNNVLYVTEKNSLIAFNASKGNILWSSLINEGNYSVSSPLISSNGIIYITQGNMIYAFNLTGEQIWNYTLTGKYGEPISFSSPVLSDDGTLIVTTNQGIFAFNDISADFTYEHVNNTERTIQFTDLSTQGNNTYYWSFGDGYYSSEQNPSHVYSKAGKYRVELLVTHEGINLARNTTIVVESWDITPPSPVSASIDGKSTKGGVFGETQIVELSASDDYSVANIFYTVDGSNPIDSATRRTYMEPINVEAYTVLKAVAVDTSNNWGKVSTFTFNITDSINVNDRVNSTLIQKIQELLDNAEEGSKFVFDYDTLYGANFTINKPLNIITNNNTKLVGNGVQPVFTIGENAKGSSINGFTITNDGADGILIKNTENISVKDSIISANDAVGINIINSANTLVKDTKVDNSTNGVIVNESVNTELERINVMDSYDNGVWILNSQKTTLKDSLLENNGEDPYFSSAHQVLLDGSNDTSILNNRINYGVFGIRLKNNNDGVTIEDNTVYEGVGDAILLEGRFSNVNITRNDLDGSFMGINFNGYSENVNVVSNLVHNMHSHPGEPNSGAEYDAFYGFKHGTDLYGSYYNCIQVWELADNFHNAVHIENNVFIKTQHRTWESRKTHTYTQASCNGYGYNLWDGSSAYTGVTNGATKYTKGFVDLVIDRVGDSSYRLRLINRLSGEYLSDIPAFDVKFTAGSYSQTVKFVDNQAVATFDVASSITDIVATISSYISQSASWNIPISDGYSSSNRDHDPGYEAGEAINNPDPKVPSIDEYIKAHQSDNNGQGNGNGQGSGTGNGQGNGNGHGSSGHGGSNVNGREGEVEGNSNNLVRTNGGTSPSVGVEAAAEGSSDSVEGGSETGETVDSAKAYEVTKEISKNINDNNMKFVLAFILFDIIVILGYGYRRGKDDGDEM